MFEAAARLQAHNQEMVKCLSTLREQRQKLADKVVSQEQSRALLEGEIAALRQQLAVLDEQLEKNRKKLTDQELKLMDAESGYNKVVDTMQILLMSVRKDEKELLKAEDEDGKKGVKKVG
ncbi:uncharacterized protein LOC129753843 [Uranotaenia lowii]|uniref:uncharacterized protein LOC129753843 n=1 Tax=Uranotaenia lowii TaxID=190385 RepID=UPI00247AB1DA|nr:uncharacterized protein LOC129753843 [Uranotaenia lowii]